MRFVSVCLNHRLVLAASFTTCIASFNWFIYARSCPIERRGCSGVGGHGMAWPGRDVHFRELDLLTF
jgi:hypothetical protein